MTIEIKRAEKSQSKLRMALTGPSGSGKTYSSLVIASGIGSKICVIDTENHRAALKAGEPEMPEFDIVTLDPPYTIEKYIEAMTAVWKANYEVLIIDSVSHAWAGEGGLLAKKEALDNSNRGNSFANWASISKEHERFKSAWLHFPAHIIVTMRSKQDYILETNDKGKAIPRKVGLAPVQRDGTEYEFSFVFDLGMDHNAIVSKTDFHSFDGRVFKPSKKTGEELFGWLNSGKKEEIKEVANA